MLPYTKRQWRQKRKKKSAATAYEWIKFGTKKARKKNEKKLKWNLIKFFRPFLEKLKKELKKKLKKYGRGYLVLITVIHDIWFHFFFLFFALLLFLTNAEPLWKMISFFQKFFSLFFFCGKEMVMISLTLK